MKIDLGLSIIGQEKKPVPVFNDPGRREIAERIAKIDMEEDVKYFLLKKLESYPDGALSFFSQNLKVMVIAERNRRSRGKPNELS